MDLTQQCKNLLFVQLQQKFRENNFFRRREARPSCRNLRNFDSLHDIFREFNYFTNHSVGKSTIKRYLFQIFPRNQSVEKEEKEDILLSRFLRKKLERFS